MNACEQQLRTELRAESELITPGSLRPLDLSRADGLASERPFSPAGGSDRRRPPLAWLAPVATAAAVALIVAATAIISHHGPSTGPQPGSGASRPTAGEISDVTVLNASDAWAVGYLDIGQTRLSNMTDVPLIEHWNGANWQRVATPTEPDLQLNSIAGTSANDLWAVGEAANGPSPFNPVIMHWNGHDWRLQRFAAASKAGLLEDVTVRSSTDAWAVGQTGGQPFGALILHWDGSTWSQVPAPAQPPKSYRFLHGVTAISAHDAWAVGSTIEPRTSASSLFIIHWNGSSWTQVPTPQLRAEFPSLQSVAAGPDGTVWAAGLAGGDHLTPLALRWTGAAWQQVAVPIPGLNAGLEAITVLSPDNVWAAGGGDDPSATMILHWNGSTWTRMSAGANFPGRVNGLTATSDSDIWAAGFRGNAGAGVPQILHWNGSKWSRSFGPSSTSGLFENSSCGPYTQCATPSGSPTDSPTATPTASHS